MFKLALASLWNRRATIWLTILSIAISTVLLLGVERIRVQTQENFANTISGTDLIVGARTGTTQLLLSSVFHIGNLSNTMSWSAYEDLQNLPGVSWHIPMAMGDSVQGFPVVATTPALFEHFKYGDKRHLEFRQGQSFAAQRSAVLGAEVASELGLTTGSELVVSHGTGDISFSQHDAHPFIVNGVLTRTGTPLDRSVFIPLTGLALVHGETSGDHGHEHEGDSHEHHEHPPVYTLSAVLIGLDTPALALRLQRTINNYEKEPLTAIMPGLALQNFWRTLSLFEQALMAISILVVITGLIGMLTTLLASLRERRREMAVLRAIGAGPFTIFGLLISEAFIVALAGVIGGVVLLTLGLFFGAELLQQSLGIQVQATLLTVREWILLAAIVVAACLLSLVPAWQAYRNALSDGLTVKV